MLREGQPQGHESEKNKKKWPFWMASPNSNMRVLAGMKAEAWAEGMDPKLEESLKDPNYLPTFAEALKIRDCREYSDAMGDHEILTQEYVRALADHLMDTALHHAPADGSPLRIVEVGAGTGRLTNFLRQALARWQDQGDVPPIEITATTRQSDQGDGDTDIPDLPILAPVEFMLADEAIEKLSPHIVIAAWPLLDNLDELVQDQASIRELIVIGEPEACHIHKGVDGWPPIPGFAEHDLKAAEKVQISRMDYLRTTNRTHSTTHIYERVEA